MVDLCVLCVNGEGFYVTLTPLTWSANRPPGEEARTWSLISVRGGGSIVFVGGKHIIAVMQFCSLSETRLVVEKIENEGNIRSHLVTHGWSSDWSPLPWETMSTTPS